VNEPLDLCDAARARIEAAGLEFLADFYGAEARRRPRNVAALTELGQVLTQLGRYEEGLRVDRELTRLLPEDPTSHYNLACSLALLGETEKACDALERAVELGYDDLEHLLADGDLGSLRDAPRFARLVARIGERSADESNEG